MIDPNNTREQMMRYRQPSCNRQSEVTAVLYKRFCDMTTDLGVPELPLKSAAILFRNQVNLGAAHYHSDGQVYNFEIGVRCDHDGCLNLLNAIISPFPHGYSCGLARTVMLDTVAEVIKFYERIGIAMAAGNLAYEILRREPLFQET